MVVANNNNERLQIVLTPNRSASWRFNCTVLKFFGLVIFGIAIGWSLAGVWIILPFAGLEFAMLVYFVYRTSQECYRKEVLHLSDSSVRLEQGLKVPQVEQEFERAACEFIKQVPSHFWSAAVIKLRCRGRVTRIGRFLNSSDIDNLWNQLVTTGIPHRVVGKTQVKDSNPFGL